ncbi:sensor histidine kinase [Streptomyces sp. x-80]|uniref:sensor histidine kinase n=1 Tax=Streptomyces sp. x-80 TaxID=2789282 RepID=UPI0039819440
MAGRAFGNSSAAAPAVLQVAYKHRDKLLALACAVAFTSLAAAVPGAGWVHSRGLCVIAALALSLVTLVRRSHPVAHLVTTVAVCLMTGQMLPFGVAAYTAVRAHRYALMSAIALAPGVLLVVAPDRLVGTSGHLVIHAYQTYVAIVLPILVGFLMNSAEARSGLEMHALRQRAKLHASERREQDLRQRAALARKIHDGIGHEISVMLMQSGAVAASPDSSESTKSACAKINRAGRSAFDQLRSTLDLLSADSGADPLDAGDEPGGTLTDVADLLSGYRKRGLSIQSESSMHNVPEPSHALRLVHTLLNEALCNVVRHASGAPVRITLCQNAYSLTVSVLNDPPQPRESAVGSRQGAGHGLGLLERSIRNCGGTFKALATPDRGFLVSALIPLVTDQDLSPTSA